MSSPLLLDLSVIGAPGAVSSRASPCLSVFPSSLDMAVDFKSASKAEQIHLSIDPQIHGPISLIFGVYNRADFWQGGKHFRTFLGKVCGLPLSVFQLTHRDWLTRPESSNTIVELACLAGPFPKTTHGIAGKV